MREKMHERKDCYHTSKYPPIHNVCFCDVCGESFIVGWQAKDAPNEEKKPMHCFCSEKVFCSIHMPHPQSLRNKPQEAKEEGVREWPCEHISFDPDFVGKFHYVKKVHGGIGYVPLEVNYCEKCGAKRPAEKRKRLATILKNSKTHCQYLNDETCEEIASVAIEEVCRVIDACMGASMDADYLKERLRSL